MMMLRRTLAVCIMVGTIAVLQGPARAKSITDSDDGLPRLDIRSASVTQMARDEVELRLVFWDRTPQWMLRRRAARIEMSFARPKHASEALGFRFWPNRRGQLRVTWGELASDCCARHGAQHPDPFTYLAVIPFSLRGAVPALQSFRALRTAQLKPCWHTICGLSGGRHVDKTAWVRT